MHVWTFLSPKYASTMNNETNFGLEEAGMKQLDDVVGSLMQHLEDIGEADNTVVVFTTDNGAEVFTWPDGGMTPFKGTKGTAYEGGFRAPCIIRWPDKVKPGSVQNGIFSALDYARWVRKVCSRHLSRSLATQTSRTTYSKASSSAIEPTRTTWMVTTK